MTKPKKQVWKAWGIFTGEGILRRVVFGRLMARHEKVYSETIASVTISLAKPKPRGRK
jgi:hypothetical protein